MINKIRDLAGAIIGIASFVAGFYVGIWVMFIQPIIYACQCFDTGTLTATIIAITILKVIFSGFVGCLVIIAGCTLASFIMTDDIFKE